MKKTITFLALYSAFFVSNAQTVITDFENFTLPTNSYYKDTNSLAFETSHATFRYEWTKGAFPYWSGGFAYTNKYDSSTASFTNLYGVKPYMGYNNSSIYTVGQDKGIIKIKVPQTTVEGFYYTNTTYAYKSIKNGDGFSRKFGDTTGTNSGTTIAQGAYPDYFKVVVQGYKNGNLLSDSVEFFLADYRFANNSQDYVVNDWRYVNTSQLGVVDSIKFLMRSTDVGQFGMNTPAFFGIDNFTTSTPNPVGLLELSKTTASVFPNPFENKLHFVFASDNVQLKMSDLQGKVVFDSYFSSGEAEVDLQDLSNGIYVVEVTTAEKREVLKLIRQANN